MDGLGAADCRCARDGAAVDVHFQYVPQAWRTRGHPGAPGEDPAAAAAADPEYHGAGASRSRACLRLAARTAAPRRALARPGAVDAAVARAFGLPDADRRTVALRPGDAPGYRERLVRLQLRSRTSCERRESARRSSLPSPASRLPRRRSRASMSDEWNVRRVKLPFARVSGAEGAARPLQFDDAQRRKPHTLADFRRQVIVLLNVWATWCAPVPRGDAGARSPAGAARRAERFQVVALSVDQQGAEIAQQLFRGDRGSNRSTSTSIAGRRGGLPRSMRRACRSRSSSTGRGARWAASSARPSGIRREVDRGSAPPHRGSRVN